MRLGDAEADYEEAQSDYEDARDKYKASLQDILERFYADKFDPELLDRIWTSADFERVLKEMEVKRRFRNEQGF